jgi:hypothetical protein
MFAWSTSRIAITAITAILVMGCGSSSTRECGPGLPMCVQGGISGTCTPSCTGSGKSYCAFPDPTDCPATGLKFGILAGESLSGQCATMCMAIDGGVTDATIGVDAAHTDASTDAGPSMSSRIVVASYFSDELYVYDTSTLAPVGTIPLPDRTGTGSRSVTVSAGTVWVGSQADLLALDPATFTPRGGYPLHFDPATTCDASAAHVEAGALYCFRNSTVYRWSGSPLMQAGSRGVSFSIDGLGGSAQRLAVSTPVAGTPSTSPSTVYVLDPSLIPVVGSPINVPFQPTIVAADDDLHRLAIAQKNGSEVRLFDLTGSLAPIGTLSIPGGGVTAIAFDAQHDQLVVAFMDAMASKLATYSANDLTSKISPISLAPAGFAPAWIADDSSRARLYVGVAESGGAGQVFVVDSATLAGVSGSPIDLPGSIGGLTYF